MIGVEPVTEDRDGHYGHTTGPRGLELGSDSVGVRYSDFLSVRKTVTRIHRGTRSEKVAHGLTEILVGIRLNRPSFRTSNL